MSSSGQRPRASSSRSGDGGERTVGTTSRKRAGSRRAQLVQRIGEAWRRLLRVPGLWITLLLLVGAAALSPGGLLPTSTVQEGQIATRDYLAPADLLLPDEETTAEKQRRAREEVPPVWDFDPGVADTVERNLAVLFQVGRQLLEGPVARGARRGADGAAEGSDPATDRAGLGSLAAEDLAAASGFKLTADQVAMLADEGFAVELEDRTRLLARRALREGVVENKDRLLEHRMGGITLRNLGTGGESLDLDLYAHLDYPEELRELLEAEVEDWRGLSTGQRRTLVDFLVANLPPNLSPNRSETLVRQEAAAAATAQAYKEVREGQVIVRRGDQIGPAAARMIAEVTGQRNLGERLLPLLGTLALLGLVVVALWLGLRQEGATAATTGRGAAADPGHALRFGEASFLLLLGLLGTKLGVITAEALASSFEASPFDSLRSYLYLVPFAAPALLGTLLFGRSGALLIAFLHSVLVGRLVGDDAFAVTLYAIVVSLAAVYAVDQYQIKQRIALLRVGLVTGLAGMAAVLVLTGLDGGGEGIGAQLPFDLLCALGGGFATAAATSFALPILESLLGITTDIKLVELSNTNTPLLRRLAFEAPGTFQHSLMVANLAKEGCEAIGADSVLAYAGGLYHDVGKVLRPDYFIENQRPGQNRHDKLQPSMSALILINHVKDGLALARRHHLPQPILDAIAQHHGSRLITFFFNRAKALAKERDRGPGDEAGERILEEKYRYPGPKPQSKVMGVLMLADGIEAASRTLVDPAPAKLRSLVHTIVDDCLDDGQLEESDMTLADLRRVSEAFLRVLGTIFHQRIDYPGFDFNQRAARPSNGGRTAGAGGAGSEAAASEGGDLPEAEVSDAVSDTVSDAVVEAAETDSPPPRSSVEDTMAARAS